MLLPANAYKIEAAVCICEIYVDIYIIMYTLLYIYIIYCIYIYIIYYICIHY